MSMRAEGLGGAIRRQLKKAVAVNNWSGIIQDWLYPPTCLLCGDPGQAGLDLCQPCHDALPWIGAACARCALPLAAPGLCGDCRGHPPAFDAAHAALRYEEPVRHLVRALKFGARYPAARLLGALLAERLRERGGALPDVILPVPLHPVRYRERGYNQSAEIARTVSGRLAIPLDLGACHRVRATSAQARLTARERRRNLQGAFTIEGRPCLGHVAILDDVVTTGSTVNELALALRRAGAERIEVWAVARAGG